MKAHGYIIVITFNGVEIADSLRPNCGLRLQKWTCDKNTYAVGHVTLMSCVFSPNSDLVRGSYWYKWRQSTETKITASTLSSIKTYYSRAERDTRGLLRWWLYVNSHHPPLSLSQIQHSKQTNKEGDECNISLIHKEPHKWVSNPHYNLWQWIHGFHLQSIRSLRRVSASKRLEKPTCRWKNT